MEWNKVNLRTRDDSKKNLPPVGERVLWATTEDAPSNNAFYNFLGRLVIDSSKIKYIETPFTRYRLTSNYWWVRIENPII